MRLITTLFLSLSIASCRSHLPEAPSLVLSPENPTTVDDLVAEVDCNDCKFRWFRNGQLQSDLDTEIVSADHTRKGEKWEVTVTQLLSDGEGDASNASTTILNSPPSKPVLELLIDTDLNCTIIEESIDPDEDEVSYDFAWILDGEDFDDTTTKAHDNDSVANEDLVQGTKWTCTVTPSDLEVQGESGTTSIEIDVQIEGDDPGECEDEIDNDLDGLIDCEDEDCLESESCPTEGFSVYLDQELVAEGPLETSVFDAVPAQVWLHTDSTSGGGSSDFKIDYIKVYDSCTATDPIFVEEFDSLSGWSIMAKGGVGSISASNGSVSLTSDYNQILFDTEGIDIGPDGYRVEVSLYQGSGSAALFLKARYNADGVDINYQPKQIWGGKGANWTEPMVEVHGTETALDTDATEDGWHHIDVCLQPGHSTNTAGDCLAMFAATDRAAASSDCQSRGGQLVWIEDATVNSKVEELCTRNVTTSNAGCWLGLKSPFTNWDNGDEVTYTNWYSPTHDGSGTCTQLYTSLGPHPEGSGQWDDVTCGNNDYICRLDCDSGDDSGALEVLEL